MSKKVTITLTVQAHSLYTLINPSQAEVELQCTLSDDNSGTTTNGIENFTSQVYIDNDVNWEGKTASPNGEDKNYSIAITSIAYEANVNGDVDFFDENILPGNNGRNATVKYKIKNDNALNGKIDVYTINFSVYASANDSKPFHIDPKLQANPK